jgi:RNA polymerase-interacting CarD/CdnL/TRCF family regulator
MAVKPPHVVQKPASLGAAAVSTGQNVTVDIANPDAGASAGGGTLTQSQMTTAYTKQLMESALQGLLEMQNRKFKYDAKSSPLYSIVQKQAEENARLASGRAYAQAKAATGGYGSSYATLAADEAGRQAMRELDDQQLALYEAARSEFEAENQSALDWYNTTKQLYADAYALEQDAKTEESAKASGMNEATYNLMIQAANEGWYTGANKEALRARLNTIAAGNPEINVDAIMNQLTAETAAATTDAASQFAMNPTMSGAANLMANAKSLGTWDTVQPEVSKSLADAYIKGVELPGSAGALIGADAEAWSGMSDEERKKTTLNNAGAAARDGLITEEDYARILMSDVGDMAEAIKAGEIEKPATAVSDLVIDWQNYRDMGYMSEETYDKIMGELASSVNAPELLNKQAFTLGEHFADMANTFADWVGGKVDVDVPDWIGNLSGGMLDVISTAGGLLTATGNNGAIGKTVGVIQAANGILSNFDWYRRTIGMTEDQEKAMKDLLKHYKE